MSDVDEFAQLMYDRFAHNVDAYSTMWYDSTKQKKGYFKQRVSTCAVASPCKDCSEYGKCTKTVDEKLAFEHMREHVLGNITLATYQLGEDNTVKYLEFDIDMDEESSTSSMQDVEDAALEIGKRLGKLFGKKSCILEYSGYKGMHIWVLFETPVAARFAFGLGHFIIDAIDVEGVNFEVFPKQTSTASYGSVTRLPFGIHKQTDFRSRMVDGNLKPYEDQLAAFREVRLISEQELLDVIDREKIQVPDSIRTDRGKGYVQFPCITRLMTEGLPKGSRDILLYRTCCYLRERGFTEDMTRLVAEDINRRSREPLDDETVQKKVESAFLADYSGLPCGLKEFDRFCSSTCPLFAKKAKWRGVTVDELRGKGSRD